MTEEDRSKEDQTKYSSRDPSFWESGFEGRETPLEVEDLAEASMSGLVRQGIVRRR